MARPNHSAVFRTESGKTVVLTPADLGVKDGTWEEKEAAKSQFKKDAEMSKGYDVSFLDDNYDEAKGAAAGRVERFVQKAENRRQKAFEEKTYEKSRPPIEKSKVSISEMSSTGKGVTKEMEYFGRKYLDSIDGKYTTNRNKALQAASENGLAIAFIPGGSRSSKIGKLRHDLKGKAPGKYYLYDPTNKDNSLLLSKGKTNSQWMKESRELNKRIKAQEQQKEIERQKRWAKEGDLI